MNERIHHPKLGTLTYQEGPQSIHSWHGSMNGCEQGFYVVLDSFDLGRVDTDFIAGILEKWESHEEMAIAHIRQKLVAEPELFNLSKEDVKDALLLPSLPFDLPQFVFYDKQEWAIMFCENGLGIDAPLGVTVEFKSHNLLGVCDLSDAEEIVP